MNDPRCRRIGPFTVLTGTVDTFLSSAIAENVGSVHYAGGVQDQGCDVFLPPLKTTETVVRIESCTVRTPLIIPDEDTA